MHGTPRRSQTKAESNRKLLLRRGQQNEQRKSVRALWQLSRQRRNEQEITRATHRLASNVRTTSIDVLRRTLSDVGWE